MEGLIDLEIASEIERKIYLAFLKGLTQIKFRSQFKKESQAKKRMGGEDQQQIEEQEVDLEYLYTNLFANTGI